MKKTEMLVDLTDKIYNEVYHTLLPDASYVSQEKQKYYSPGYGAFEYVVSNIALAFILHIFSIRIYEKYFANKAKLSKMDLDDIKRIVKTEIESKEDQKAIEAKPDNHIIIEKIENLLQNSGWPSEKAKLTARELFKIMKDVKDKGFSE